MVDISRFSKYLFYHHGRILRMVDDGGYSEDGL